MTARSGIHRNTTRRAAALTGAAALLHSSLTPAKHTGSKSLWGSQRRPTDRDRNLIKGVALAHRVQGKVDEPRKFAPMEVPSRGAWSSGASFFQITDELRIKQKQLLSLHSTVYSDG